MESNQTDDDFECESGYPMGQITQAQAKQLLSKRYWSWEKISSWIETLPQVQELRKQEKKQKDDD